MLLFIITCIDSSESFGCVCTNSILVLAVGFLELCASLYIVFGNVKNRLSLEFRPAIEGSLFMFQHFSSTFNYIN